MGGCKARPRGRRASVPGRGGGRVTQVAPHSARHGRDDTPDLLRPQAASRREPLPQGRLRGRHATGYDQGFAGVVWWTIVGSLLPGAGLIAAGRRTAGRLLVALTFIFVGGLVAFALFGDTTSFALHFATNTNNLLLVAGGALLLAFLWAFVVLGTHLSLRRFASLTGPQRALSTLLVASIIGAGGMVAAQAANYSLIGRTTLQAITDHGVPTEHQVPVHSGQADPWADIPRVNVL